MSGGAPVFVKGRFLPSCMEVETLCYSGRVVLQGTDFWRSSVHCTVSHPQSTCQAEQQMLAGLHRGQAASGPQWEPPWPQTGPQLQHSDGVGCPAGCCQLSLSAGSHLCKVWGVAPLFSLGLFKGTFYCCGLLDSL